MSVDLRETKRILESRLLETTNPAGWRDAIAVSASADATDTTQHTFDREMASRSLSPVLPWCENFGRPWTASTTAPMDYASTAKSLLRPGVWRRCRGPDVALSVRSALRALRSPNNWRPEERRADAAARARRSQ